MGYTEDDVKRWKKLKDKGYSLGDIAHKEKESKGKGVFVGTISKKLKELDATEKGTVGEKKQAPIKTGGGEKKVAEQEEASAGTIKIDERVTADDFSIIDDLIKRKVAGNRSDAIRKALRLLGAVTTPEIADSYKESTSVGRKEDEIDLGDTIKILKQKAVIETLKGGDSGGIDLNKLITLQVLQGMVGQKNQGQGGNNSEMQSIRDEIRNLVLRQERDAERQRTDQMISDLRNVIVQIGQKKEGSEWKDILTVIEKGKADVDKVRVEHEAKVEVERAKAEAAKEETRRTEIQHLKDDVEGLIGKESENRQWTDSITKTVMEHAMSTVKTQYERGAKAVTGEKSTGEIAKDLVQGVITTLNKDGKLTEAIGSAMTPRQQAYLTPEQVAALQKAEVQRTQIKPRRKSSAEMLPDEKAGPESLVQGAELPEED